MADWTKTEVDLIVADYFLMLQDEILSKHYNKSEHRSYLVPLLNNRTEGSVEFKHQNISAVLVKLGLPYIKGYKPLSNYQELLVEGVLEYLQLKKDEIEATFDSFATSSVVKSITVDFSNILESPPELLSVSEDKPMYGRKPFKVDYLQREQTNSILGERGEQFVLDYEKWSLIKAGKANLADKIEWISKSDDGAGFDILSKNLNGSDKFIEVKTTKLSKEAPFYFSANEYNFSKKQSDKYHLYRVFKFGASPKMFQAQGNFDSFCYKEPTIYRGSFGV